MTLIFRRHAAFGFVVAAIMVGASSVQAQVSLEYTMSLRDGREAYKADQFTIAESHFKAMHKASQSPRQRASALGLLAMTAEQRKQLQDARRYAEEALREFPAEARAKDVLSRLGGGAAQ